MTTQTRSRIIVDVEPDFHKRVKQVALERDKTVKELVTECLSACIGVRFDRADVERLAQGLAASCLSNTCP